MDSPHMTKAIVFPEVAHDGVIGLKLHDHQGNRIFEDMEDTTYADIWKIHCDEWVDAVREYETGPGDFYNAYHYLDKHPMFWEFRHGHHDTNPMPVAERIHVRNLVPDYGINRCVDIAVVRVHADTRSTEDEPRTATEVWIELGQRKWPVEFDQKDPNTWDTNVHDYMLDCGGPTVETAIIRAAHNVWEVYGNDRRICDGPYDKLNYVTMLDSEDFDELMRTLDDPGEVNERVRRATQRLHDAVMRAKTEDIT